MRWLNKYYKGFNRLWLAFGVFWIIGCGEGYNILYPGAPIVSIQESAVIWVEPQILGFMDATDPETNTVVPIPIFGEGDFGFGQVHIDYLLSLKEPLPYDIEVSLAVSGKSNTLQGVTGVIDVPISHSIEKGALVSGKRLLINRFDDLDVKRNEPIEGAASVELIGKLRIQTVTVSIEPWDAIGDDAYNVGSPSTFTVNRIE